MGEIKKVEYKQEWMDHLDVLYGSFIRRNDTNTFWWRK